MAKTRQIASNLWLPNSERDVEKHATWWAHVYGEFCLIVDLFSLTSGWDWAHEPMKEQLLLQAGQWKNEGTKKQYGIYISLSHPRPIPMK